MASEKSNDHDLLIELRTLMRGVIEDIKRLSDNNELRLKALELGKLDKKDADIFKEQALETKDQMEARLRALEDDNKISKAQMKTYLAIGGSALAFAQVIIQMALNFFKA